VKTRIGIIMLVLGCLIAMSVYAAEEGAKETTVATVPSVEAVVAKGISLESAI